MSATEKRHPLASVGAPPILALQGFDAGRIAHIGGCSFVGRIPGEPVDPVDCPDIDVDQEVDARDLVGDTLQRLIAVIARAVRIIKDEPPLVTAADEGW